MFFPDHDVALDRLDGPARVDAERPALLSSITSTTSRSSTCSGELPSPEAERLAVEAAPGLLHVAHKLIEGARRQGWTPCQDARRRIDEADCGAPPENAEVGWAEQPRGTPG
jgi:hypothetical protein